MERATVMALLEHSKLEHWQLDFKEDLMKYLQRFCVDDGGQSAESVTV
jgi:hypothetical protein